MTAPISFNDSRWRSLNMPKHPIDVSDDGSTAVITTNSGDDWWRTLERDSKDGVVYGYKVPLKGRLEVSVELDIDWKDQYDQAQLLLQLGPSTWVKTGLEFDGQLFAGVVVTYPYSDWSTQPAGSTPPKKFSITLDGRSLKVFFDGVMAREVNVFGDQEKEVLVGIMACSPKGGGAKATFKDFRISQ